MTPRSKTIRTTVTTVLILLIGLLVLQSPWLRCGLRHQSSGRGRGVRL